MKNKRCMDYLKGKMVVDFFIREHGFCSLALSEGYSIGAETLCRFIGPHGEFLSSTDHRQPFGLHEPLDVAQAIREQIQKKRILDAEVKTDTADLILEFENSRFEIICNSSGYECWTINGPGNLIIVGRGGSTN